MVKANQPNAAFIDQFALQSFIAFAERWVTARMMLTVVLSPCWASRSSLRVLFLSGYPKDEVFPAKAAANRAPYLQKPVDCTQQPDPFSSNFSTKFLQKMFNENFEC